MATLPVWWQLTVLFITINNRGLAVDSLPSKPRCYIPCDELSCQVDIQCLWDPWQDQNFSTIYILHWETVQHGKKQVNTGNLLSGIILREHFSKHSKLSVWVQAVHQNGSAESEKSVFRPLEITKPPAPKMTSSHRDPLEINWNLTCKQLHLCIGPCDVRHRTETENEWIETEIGSRASYELHNPVQPGVIYEFQVRCQCCTGLMSDWSRTTRIMSQEMAPVSELDVWKDCGVFQEKTSCVLMWKILSRSQARGEILGYEVLLNNGTVVQKNISTAQPSDQLVCDQTKCYLNVPLMLPSSASVSAYNSVGATAPAHLTSSTPGNENNKEILRFQMNTEKLNVSWNLPARLSDDEYVIQYKQVGQPLGQGFDWSREKQSRGSKTFKDKFREYTPYKVSLYEHSGERSRHHSTAIAYSLQKIPPKVPIFEVIHIDANHVTLFWEPIPLSMQTGEIISYQIGGETLDAVYNVTADLHNKTWELTGLSPGRDYEVWIKAVTKAGPGANVTARFKTKSDERKEYVIVQVGVFCVLIVIVITGVFLGACQGDGKCWFPGFSKNVPNPQNSLILKEIKNQKCNNSVWILTHVVEQPPEISLLEVMESKTSAISNGCLQAFYLDEQMLGSTTQECERTDQRPKKEEYSQMLDSEEEQGGEQKLDHDEQWSSSEEDLMSGYEEHFMPTPQEILGSQPQEQL